MNIRKHNIELEGDISEANAILNQGEMNQRNWERLKELMICASDSVKQQKNEIEKVKQSLNSLWNNL